MNSKRIQVASSGRRNEEPQSLLLGLLSPPQGQARPQCAATWPKRPGSPSAPAPGPRHARAITLSLVYLDSLPLSSLIRSTKAS